MFDRPTIEKVLAQEAAKRRPLGCALAMRVMQSDLYQQLDDTERADCDELVRRNLEWFKADSSPGVSRPDGQTFSQEPPVPVKPNELKR